MFAFAIVFESLGWSSSPLMLFAKNSWSVSKNNITLTLYRTERGGPPAKPGSERSEARASARGFMLFLQHAFPRCLLTNSTPEHSIHKCASISFILPHIRFKRSGCGFLKRFKALNKLSSGSDRYMTSSFLSKNTFKLGNNKL